MEVLLEVDELRRLGLHQPVERDTGGLGDDLGDVLGVDLLLEHALVGLEFVEVGGRLVDASLEFGDTAVPHLGGDGEVGLALDLRAQALQLLLQGADRVDRLLLLLPVLTHLGGLGIERGQLVVQRLETLGRRGVGLLLERDLLDLELEDAPLDDVDLGRQRVDLDPQLRRRLVDEVDRLVGQEAARDVPVGQDGCADERRVLDAHAVVHLVALLQAAQDADRVLDRRLADVHLLEPALEGRVLLDVLAVLVEGRRADHPQLAAGEHRLDHVAGIHRALGAAGADDGVQFVDERDHLPVGVGDLLEDRLEALLELAAVLGTGEHRGDVERDEPLVLESLGDVAVGDARGEALDDRRLADARFADEHRVVLGPPRQHLDAAPDLLVTSDDRVDLAVGGAGGEVLAVLLERGELLLGVLVGDPVRSTHVLQDLQQLLGADVEAGVHRQQQVLDRQEVVAQVLAVRIGVLDDVVQFLVHPRLGAAVGLGQLLHGLVGAVADHQRRLTELRQHGRHDRALLAHHGAEQVIGRQFRIGQ